MQSSDTQMTIASEVEIRSLRPNEDAVPFRTLNEEWIARFFVMEQMGAKSLFLGSNSKLANALHLYESVGFRHIPPEKVPPSGYTRGNVFVAMQLCLSVTTRRSADSSSGRLPWLCFVEVQSCSAENG